jgi:hypothetical protein
MGDRLGRSEKTVPKSRSNIVSKLGSMAVHKRLCMRVMQALAARSSDETLGMSAQGHGRTKSDVRLTSAFVPIATG